MNLRVTPSFNTQQIQNSRQNPNFGMIKCPDAAAVARLHEIAQMSNNVVLSRFDPASQLFRGLSGDQVATLQKFSDVFQSDGDLGVIYRRSEKEPLFSVLLDMASHATEVTMEAITAMATKWGVPEEITLAKASNGCLKELGVDTGSFR